MSDARLTCPADFSNAASIKTISISLILCTFSYGQLIWSEGNLKKVDQISLEIVVSGDQDPTWEEKLTQISLLFFEGYKLKINPKTFSPNMVINVSILKSNDLSISSYDIDLSVFDLFISKDKYLDNISSKKIIKKFKSGIIYQQNLFGQSEHEKIIQDVENSLVSILNTFINDWYQDNPMKQF